MYKSSLTLAHKHPPSTTFAVALGSKIFKILWIVGTASFTLLAWLQRSRTKAANRGSRQLSIFEIFLGSFSVELPLISCTVVRNPGHGKLTRALDVSTEKRDNDFMEILPPAKTDSAPRDTAHGPQVTNAMGWAPKIWNTQDNCPFLFRPPHPSRPAVLPAFRALCLHSQQAEIRGKRRFVPPVLHPGQRACQRGQDPMSLLGRFWRRGDYGTIT